MSPVADLSSQLLDAVSVFHQHVHYFVHPEQVDPPEDLRQLLESLCEQQKLSPPEREAVLANPHSRKVMFMMSYERESHKSLRDGREADLGRAQAPCNPSSRSQRRPSSCSNGTDEAHCSIRRQRAHHEQQRTSSRECLMMRFLERL